MFLTRDLTVQHGVDEIYDVGARGHVRPPWHHDTSIGGLGLDAQHLESLRGQRVLDVASGLSILPTELSALGAEVDCADLEVDAEHPAIPAVRTHLQATYEQQLELLHCLARHAKHPRYALADDQVRLLDTLRGAAGDIADTYPNITGRRYKTDATTLAPLPSDHFDLVVCGWLLVHLTPEQEQRVIEAMLRVAKPGARVHIRAGYGGTLTTELPHRPVTSQDDLLVIAAR